MAFVRCGGRVVAYGRGERERTTWEQKMRFEERTAPPQRVVISQIGDPNAPYLKDIEQLDHENSALQREIDGLKKSISSFTYTQVNSDACFSAFGAHCLRNFRTGTASMQNSILVSRARRRFSNVWRQTRESATATRLGSKTR